MSRSSEGSDEAQSFYRRNLFLKRTSRARQEGMRLEPLPEAAFGESPSTAVVTSRSLIVDGRCQIFCGNFRASVGRNTFVRRALVSHVPDPDRILVALPRPASAKSIGALVPFE